MTELMITRDPQTIANEINHIKDQTRAILLFNSIEIGRRLVEAKKQVPHGEWGKWLGEAVDFSQSTAINHMKIFEQYGSDQISLFGDNTKSQAFAKLSYSQAVALLVVPEEEREHFIEENDVENISTRELQEAIKAKAAAEHELNESKEKEQIALKAHERVSNDKKELDQLTREQSATIRKLNSDLASAQKSGDSKAAEKAMADVKKANEQLAEQQKKIKELQEQLKAQPIEVPKVEIKEVVPDHVEQELADLRKKLAQNNNLPGMKYRVQFDTIKTLFADLMGSLSEIKTTNPEEHEKFRNATAALIGEMQKKL